MARHPAARGALPQRRGAGLRGRRQHDRLLAPLQHGAPLLAEAGRVAPDRGNVSQQGGTLKATRAGVRDWRQHDTDFWLPCNMEPHYWLRLGESLQMKVMCPCAAEFLQRRKGHLEETRVVFSK